MNESAPGLVVSRTAGGVARVVLNRPAVHNAFDDTTIAALDRAFAGLDADADVRAVVLAGAGKSFSAGADLNWMKRTAVAGREENLADARALGAMLYRIATLSKPVIGLIGGAARGGGVGLAACCDIAIAADSATFAFSEVRLGLIPAAISPYVIAATGAREARRYFVTGATFDAAEARRIGLVHEVVPADALEEAGERTVAGLAANGPRAMAACKELVAAVSGRPVDDTTIADTARRIADARASAEGREGMAAFLARRRPDWDRR